MGNEFYSCANHILIFFLLLHEFQKSTHKIIDIFHAASRIAPNMFRDHASILMEAKAKRKPNSATAVAGSGLFLVEQEHEKNQRIALS